MYIAYVLNAQKHTVGYYHIDSVGLIVVVVMSISGHYYQVGDVLNRLFVVDKGCYHNRIRGGRYLV